MRTRAAVPVVLSLLLAACGDGAASGDGRPVVVATIPQLADMARAVAGDRAEVVGLIPATADPHDYEIRPRDVDALARATLVLRSGGEVDGWLDDALAAAGGDAPVVTLKRGEDPHWWQDPRAGAAAVQRIGAALAERDPGGTHAARASRYAERLGELDRRIAACWRRVPAAARRIVTTHDALGAYARRYGLRIVGAVIPSRSTQGQASVASAARLVELIRRQRVRAVFPESSVGVDLERAIAREAGARIGRTLYADGLGPPGTPAGTYPGSLAHNTRALVEGVTGGDVRCSI